MGIIVGIIGLVLLSLWAGIHCSEKARRARANFIGYVNWRDYPSRWEYLVPQGHPAPKGSSFMEMEWFDTLEAVVASLRSHPFPHKLWLVQSDGTKTHLPFDASLTDEQIAEAILAAIT